MKTMIEKTVDLVTTHIDYVVEAIGKSNADELIMSLDRMVVAHDGRQVEGVSSYATLLCTVIKHTIEMILAGVDLKSTRSQVEYLIENPSMKVSIVNALEAHYDNCIDPFAEGDIDPYSANLSTALHAFKHIGKIDIESSIWQFELLQGSWGTAA